MKQLILSFLVFANSTLFAQLPWPSQNCNQQLAPLTVVKYNYNATLSPDNWAYFGSANQTRVRVKYEYNAVPQVNSTISPFVCPCTSGLQGTTAINILKNTFTVEAELKFGNSFGKYSSFKPKFRLTFTNSSHNYGNSSYITAANNGALCKNFSGIMNNYGLGGTNAGALSGYFFDDSKPGNGYPGKWDYNGYNEWKSDDVNFNNAMTMYPTGVVSLNTTDSWYVSYPRLVGIVKCEVKIGWNSWSNIGNITID